MVPSLSRFPLSSEEENSQQPYQYSQLKGLRSIRLVELQPASSEDSSRLVAKLVEFDLDGAPPYEAISYTWGSPVFDQVIDFPDGRLHITDNLASALRRFLHPATSQARLVWADQICINQADNLERSQQVSIMGDIYTGARGVLVWLGVGNEATAQAINGLKSLAAVAALCGVHGIKDAVVKPDFLQSTDQENQIMQELVASYDFAQLQPLYSRPWFSRLWIIQEVCLSSNVAIFYADDVIDFGIFSLATAVISKIQSSHIRTKFPMHSMVDSALDVIALREIRFKQGKIVGSLNPEKTSGDVGSQFSNPAEWMPAYHDEKLLDYVSSLGKKNACTDDRDRVYGLLSLRSDNDVIIKSDYSKDVFEVYTAFARSCLEKQYIRILHYAGLANNSASESSCADLDVIHRDFPSWAVDWRMPQTVKFGGGNSTLFTAGTGLDVYVKTEKDGSMIELTCTVIDMIEGCCNAEIGGFESSKPLNYSFEASRKSILNLKAYFDTHHGNGRYPPAEIPVTAFARTIIADMVPTGLQSMKLLLKDSANKSELLNLWLMFEKTAIEENGALRLDPQFCLPSPVPGRPYTRQQTVYLAWLYMTSLASLLKKRQFFVSSKKHIGLAPAMCVSGDLLVLVGGCQAPFVLRFDREKKAFRMVGECYLHGFMNRELLTEEHCRGVFKIF